MKTLLKTMTLFGISGAAALAAASAEAQTLSPAEKELAAENFLQADIDKDGALTRGEFQTMINLNADDGLGRAGLIRRFGRYDMAFGRVDANADGFVTPQEMQAAAQG